MIAIVTKNNGESQFPGGHPEQGENHIETSVREVNEEAGLDIVPFISKLTPFGYYLVDEEEEKYLQLRFLLRLPDDAKAFPLSVNEKSHEERPVESARWVDLLDLPNYISWTRDIKEYKNVMDLVLNKERFPF
jgi:8-oxo-dGTP pyrophosphatase MutT (NUDIX family)